MNVFPCFHLETWDLHILYFTTGGAAITDENNLEEDEIELTNHLTPYEAAQGSSSRGTAPMTGRKLTGLVKDEEGAVTTPPGDPPRSKLAEYDLALEATKGLLGNLSDHVTSVENQVMLLSQKQLLDSQLLQLQQSFMNFTSQVYQLQHWRVTTANRGKPIQRNTIQYNKIQLIAIQCTIKTITAIIAFIAISYYYFYYYNY